MVSCGWRRRRLSPRPHPVRSREWPGRARHGTGRAPCTARRTSVGRAVAAASGGRRRGSGIRRGRGELEVSRAGRWWSGRRRESWSWCSWSPPSPEWTKSGPAFTGPPGTGGQPSGSMWLPLPARIVVVVLMLDLLWKGWMRLARRGSRRGGSCTGGRREAASWCARRVPWPGWMGPGSRRARDAAVRVDGAPVTGAERGGGVHLRAPAVGGDGRGCSITPSARRLDRSSNPIRPALRWSWSFAGSAVGVQPGAALAAGADRGVGVHLSLARER